MNSLSFFDCGVNRLFSPTISRRLAFFAAAHIAVASFVEAAMGFSHRTWEPAFSAAMVGAAWKLLGVQTETMSSLRSFSITFQSVYTCGTLNFLAAARAVSSRRSHTASIVAAGQP